MRHYVVKTDYVTIQLRNEIHMLINKTALEFMEFDFI